MDGSSNSSKIYTNGSIIRGEHTAEFSDFQEECNMIRENDKTYVWQPSRGEGFVFDNVDEVEIDNPASSQDEYEAIDLDEEIDLQCNEWNPNKELFEIPSDIRFQDISQNIDTVN